MNKKIKMFCLPYAGGSAKSYLSWNNYLKEMVDIIPVQLAGRGERLMSKPYNNFQEMADESYEFIKQVLESEENKRYIIFGHSMGSWITYEICKRIYNSSVEKPEHIIFSANGAPYYGTNDVKVSNLSDEEFVEEVLRFGGAKREILEDKRYGEIFLHILRTDFELIEEYVCDKDNFKMECDISIFNGIKDNITNEELYAWKSCTYGSCNFYNFEGGHFFIEEDEKEVMKVLKKILINLNNKSMGVNYEG
ncbi:thioesterase II family protein [Clostridium felsineum]|uniref:Linear gramicidin dehydrogenase LgrE n=1 Tax=Clostridium felsineum TaxID=36839 RepID=A0A1S8MHW5_9CLOT|nr:thioesterase domain-containing protein [Clostridium felsineum]MCR3759104.1 thioesterase II family protein [Clostridium felsineum]URZ07165.1 Linear gramicidin dehydrogenase LgrE [Clostridium felsineum]URZ12195.1 Linear gramicidin dehydrogenase LgrE [Clostridium felsineum]URZ16786.1 Linear gramicidin dehydrogenase LgrE [Clostridium felsineum DSM 794]